MVLDEHRVSHRTRPATSLPNRGEFHRGIDVGEGEGDPYPVASVLNSFLISPPQRLSGATYIRLSDQREQGWGAGPVPTSRTAKIVNIQLMVSPRANTKRCVRRLQRPSCQRTIGLAPRPTCRRRGQEAGAHQHCDHDHLRRRATGQWRIRARASLSQYSHFVALKAIVGADSSAARLGRQIGSRRPRKRRHR